MVKYPGYYSDEADEFITVPYKWEICSQCCGDGRSSAYLGAFTWDELHEQGDEFIEDYFAGNYDRVCECCEGSGKIVVADYDKMTEEQAKKYTEQVEADYAYESERRAEMRMMYK